MDPVSPGGTFGSPWCRARRWLRSHSIRVRLYSVSALLFLSILGLGAFGFAHLSDLNHASEVIRNHWLRDTGILGDLSNYMSDYRAAEANRLLSSTPAQVAASEKDIAGGAREPHAPARRPRHRDRDPERAARR
jgi:hypothetical protein